MKTQKVLIPLMILSFILIGCKDTKDTAVRKIETNPEGLVSDPTDIGNDFGTDGGVDGGTDGNNNGGPIIVYSDLIQTATQKTLNQTETKFIFVIDNSDSMADEQSNLAASLNGFVQNLVNSNNDFHMLVTTTNLAHKGQLTHGEYELTKSAYNANPSKFMSDFSKAVNIGICQEYDHLYKGTAVYEGVAVNCGDEAPIINGRAILEKYTQAPNKIIESDDNVVISFFSDETAHIFGDKYQDKVSATNNMNTVIPTFYNYISASNINFYTVYLPYCYVNADGSSQGGFRNDSIQQCEQNNILANMTNGHGFDIRNNFSDFLNDVANTATSYQTSFVLNQVPNEYTTFKVKVNGVTLSANQYTFNANTKTVTITDPNMLIDAAEMKFIFVDGIKTVQPADDN